MNMRRLPVWAVGTCSSSAALESDTHPGVFFYGMNGIRRGRMKRSGQRGIRAVKQKFQQVEQFDLLEFIKADYWATCSIQRFSI